MNVKLLIAAAAIAVMTGGAANAECRIFGIKYAAGAQTRDPGGSTVYCNPNGTWQSTPVWQFPEIKAGYRFVPLAPVPRNGFERRQRQIAIQNYRFQRQLEYFLGDW